jgi:iron(III) transport system substrate-binding protein
VKPRLLTLVAPLIAVLLYGSLSACTVGSPASGSAGSGGPAGSITLYTSVTQDTVDAVLAAFSMAHPQINVDVFRAPTAALDARIATESRSGGIKGDVLWATDPLSTAAYASQRMLRRWTPASSSVVPAADHTDTSWGTRFLNLVIVARDDLATKPKGWSDLVSPAYAGGVAIPDPGFAGSAFAALGYFTGEPGYGIEYYSRLHDNGAVQVSAIGDVISGVAQGRYQAGIALDKSVRDEVAKGSPISLVWPEPGAIQLYSPVAIFEATRNAAAAETFGEFLLGREAQAAIASTGWQPIRADVPGPQVGPTVSLDWTAVFGHQQELLDQYRAIFGG